MKPDAFRICVLGGAGYVGLITSAGLAALGHRVWAADLNRSKVEMLQQGRSPIHEPGLEPLLEHLLKEESIQFTTDSDDAIRSAEAVIIAVGSPSAEGGEADISQALAAVNQIASNMNNYKLIIIKSTLPLGMNAEVRSILGSNSQEGQQFDLLFNPEFLREGRGLHDFFHAERIVVGGQAERALEAARRMYAPLLSGSYRLPPGAGQEPPAAPPAYMETSMVEAQMIKYASNAYLASRISFVNELAFICERFGADMRQVLHGIKLDPRIGSQYLQPGLGFGGPCLEKDLNALIRIAEEGQYDPIFFKGALARNSALLKDAAAKLGENLAKPLYESRIAVFGIAFKPGTNDARSSVAVRLMTSLLNAGAAVAATDPLVSPAELQQEEPRAEHFVDPYAAAKGADALILMNDDPAYRELDYARVAAAMGTPLVYDTRHCLDRAALEGFGITVI